jgi:hypothetical protein
MRLKIQYYQWNISSSKKKLHSVRYWGPSLHQVTMKPKLLHLNVSYVFVKQEFYYLKKKYHMSSIACIDQKVWQFLEEAAWQNMQFVVIFSPLLHKNCKTYSVLKFFYKVYKLTNFQLNLKRSGCGLWRSGMECLQDAMDMTCSMHGKDKTCIQYHGEKITRKQTTLKT